MWDILKRCISRNSQQPLVYVTQSSDDLTVLTAFSCPARLTNTSTRLSVTLTVVLTHTSVLTAWPEPTRRAFWDHRDTWCFVLWLYMKHLWLSALFFAFALRINEPACDRSRLVRVHCVHVLFWNMRKPSPWSYEVWGEETKILHETNVSAVTT